MQLKRFFFSKWLVLALIILALLGTAINASLMSDDATLVVSVGKERITIGDFILEYKKHERYFQSMFNFGLTEAQLREMGIGRVVLTNLIQEKVMEQLFNRMGLHIDDSLAINRIKKNPAFSEAEKFNRAKLDDFLDRNDLTEREYIEKVKQEIGKEFVFAPFFTTQGDYKKLAELFYNLEYQIREVSISKMDKSKLPAISIPTESELLSFYEANKKKFVSDEYRAAEYLVISENTVNKELFLVPEADVKKNFESLRLGQRYYISYMEFDSRDDAERMKKSIPANPEFYANDLKHIEGAVEADLPDFLPKNVKWDGNKWQLVKYLGKFYIYTVVKIVSVSPEEREKNLKELSKFMRMNKLNQVIEQIRGDLSSGVDWKMLKTKYGIEVKSLVPVCKSSLDMQGKKVSVSKALLDAIFASKEGSTDEVISAADELIIFTVTSVAPMAEQPFKKVRTKVIKALSEERQMEAALELLKQQQEKDENLERVELYRLEVGKRKLIKYKYPDAFIEEVFKLNIGDVTQLFESDTEFLLAKVLAKKIPQLDEVAVAAIEAKIREEVGFSMLSELTQAAMKEFKIKVNTNLIKDLL